MSDSSGIMPINQNKSRYSMTRLDKPVSMVGFCGSDVVRQAISIRFTLELILGSTLGGYTNVMMKQVESGCLYL